MQLHKHTTRKMYLQDSMLLAVLNSDARQGYPMVILLSSTRPQLRLPAALRTPQTQQPVHCESDIAKAKNRKHKRSFPHCHKRPNTLASAAGNIHKTTYPARREAEAEQDLPGHARDT